MRKKLPILLVFVFLQITACHRNINPIVVFYTSKGVIKTELYPKKAPITVANFIAYIDSQYYDNALFYRTVKPNNQPNNNIKIEVIQGGLSLSDSDDEFPPIEHENTLHTGIKHLDGTISMARDNPGSASSEFFICIGDQPELDFGGHRNSDGLGFSAFGKVIEGIDVVLLIHKLPDYNQILIQPAIIDSVRIIK